MLDIRFLVTTLQDIRVTTMLDIRVKNGRFLRATGAKTDTAPHIRVIIFPDIL